MRSCLYSVQVSFLLGLLIDEAGNAPKLQKRLRVAWVDAAGRLCGKVTLDSPSVLSLLKLLDGGGSTRSKSAENVLGF